MIDKLIHKFEEVQWMMLYSIVVLGISGISRGLDDGVIAGSVSKEVFQKTFDIKGASDEIANQKGSIVSVSNFGGILGCLVAILICDRIGRKRTLMIALVIWIIGAAVEITSYKTSTLQIGRFIVGITLGLVATSNPAYITEVAPPLQRGKYIGLFGASYYFGLITGYFSNYATALKLPLMARSQWVIPMSLQILVGGVLLVLSFFVYESPRWLVERGKHDKAIKELAVLRKKNIDDEEVVRELQDIVDQLLEQQVERSPDEDITVDEHGQPTITPKTLKQQIIWQYQILSDLFKIPNLRNRVIISGIVQFISQWSGAGSLTIFAPDMFRLVGFEDETTKLFYSCFFGVSKFVGSILCMLFILDKLGRKKSLYIGITLQLVSLIYLMVYLIFNIEHFARFDIIQILGYVGTGALYINGVGWSVGWNSVQFLVNSEMFPLQYKATAGALSISFHYLFYYSLVRVTPVMLVALRPYGFMAFFIAMNIIGLITAAFIVPELNGASLETIEKIFSNKKCTAWNAGIVTRRMQKADYKHDDDDENNIAVIESNVSASSSGSVEMKTTTTNIDKTEKKVKNPDPQELYYDYENSNKNDTFVNPNKRENQQSI